MNVPEGFGKLVADSRAEIASGHCANREIPGREAPSELATASQRACPGWAPRERKSLAWSPVVHAGGGATIPRQAIDSPPRVLDVQSSRLALTGESFRGGMPV